MVFEKENRSMKTIFVVAGIVLILAAPMVAGVVYENGPVNGQTDAWTINFGYTISDSFTVSSGPTNLTGLSFWAWLTPGDTLESVEVWIEEFEYGGSTYFDQMVSLTQSDCLLNNFGYNVCRYIEVVAISPV